jgi:Uma2 family endonuclease
MVLAQPIDTVKELVTAEELWQMGGRGENFELVKGELVEMTPPGETHGHAALSLGSRLFNFVEIHKLGKMMVESGYKLSANPDTVRAPDISFLSATKIPTDGLPDGYINGAPDLAVEVVSPGDTASEIQNKVQDYLAYGTQLVWVVYPQQRLVVTYYPDGTARTLRETDSLSGETVIPGFSCRVSDIFG